MKRSVFCVAAAIITQLNAVKLEESCAHCEPDLDLAQSSNETELDSEFLPLLAAAGPLMEAAGPALGALTGGGAPAGGGDAGGAGGGAGGGADGGGKKGGNANIVVID